MDIRSALIKEHSKTTTEKIARTIEKKPEQFKELMSVLLGKDYVLAQRAAWAFNYTVERSPELLTPYLKDIILKLDTKDAHPAVYRNILRVLQDYPVPEKYHSLLLDQSFKRLTDATQDPAIRAFAMSCAANICKHYPELKRELLLLINGLLDYPQAPAIVARAKKVRKELKS